MKKVTVMNRLTALKSTLAEYGVASVGLFGSTLRGDGRADSDIDILIDFEAGKETYGNFLMVCDVLQQVFKKAKLDVVTRKGLSPYIGQNILNEVEYV